MVVNVSNRVRRSINGNNHLATLFAFDRIDGFVVRARCQIYLTSGLDVRIGDGDFD